MSLKQFIAVDLGASSGRVILADIHKTITLHEIHRFPNHPILKDGHFQWDLPGLFHEIKQGLSKIAASGVKEVDGIGVDTWGVDFGFIGPDDEILGNPYCYRDNRTKGTMDRVSRKIPLSEIYSITGIQFMEFNSLFQLFSMVESGHPVLDTAESLLFMPDLFHFLLTGNRQSEYTIASTSQLLNAQTQDWSGDLFRKLGLPLHLMEKLIPPGSIAGSLRTEIENESGLHVKQVIVPGSHDTASAVAAVPADSLTSWAYLSSGTWSLLGVECANPLINEHTRNRNYTNEGGANGKTRFLKNVSGMWLFEECRRQWGESAASYQNLLKQAGSSQPFHSLVFPDDPGFLNPPDMTEAIRLYCKRTGQPAPESYGQYIRCILESLALRYRQIIEELNDLQEKKVDVLHIVGGGCQNELLNQMTADALGIPVYAGPVEATALGNIITQAITARCLDSFESGRAMIAQSFPIHEYQPINKEPWDGAFARFIRLTQDL